MIEFNQVSKKYARDVVALRDITLTVNKGDLIFLAGPSGAGKSTLLNLIAAIERPSSGTLTVSGANVGKLKSSGLPYLRRNLRPDPATAETTAGPHGAGQCDAAVAGHRRHAQ